jgi:hypothetical protein
MYFLLTLFFVSLLGITFMIGRKLLVLERGAALQKEEEIFKDRYFEELKNFAVKNVRKHGYTGLVASIRFYVRSSNALKNKYQNVKTNVKNLRMRKSNHIAEEKREVSKFLKMISEYKHKIRQIKRKIKEEEKLQ